MGEANYDSRPVRFVRGAGDFVGRVLFLLAQTDSQIDDGGIFGGGPGLSYWNERFNWPAIHRRQSCRNIRQRNEYLSRDARGNSFRKKIHHVRDLHLESRKNL